MQIASVSIICDPVFAETKKFKKFMKKSGMQEKKKEIMLVYMAYDST